MPAGTYQTVPDELVPHADYVREHLRVRGFRVRVEHLDLGAPYTPAFQCTRERTTAIFELMPTLDFARLEQWARYGRSCGRDTRVVVCLPMTAGILPRDRARLDDLGVGLYLVDPGTRVEEAVPPKDLALSVALPPRGALPRRLREILATAYDQFEKGAWREGFDDACKAFEREARAYLKKHLKLGKQLYGPKGVRVLTSKQLNKLPMGPLAEAFGQIHPQSQTDAILVKTLAAINKDRVGVTHFKTAKRTENRLRANVGRHMWSIVNAMRQIH